MQFDKSNDLEREYAAALFNFSSYLHVLEDGISNSCEILD